ncbi:MAG TPA: hypothetical protein DCQ28_05000 [Bacteroidetes bacterium]|nr:hypothetical protein [Bacteroidota bacterium]
MKISSLLLLFVLYSTTLFSQNSLDAYDTNETLTSDQCFTVIKTVWDGLKKLSEEYDSNNSTKGEFESTQEFNQRKRNNKDEYIAKISKYYSDHKLNTRTFSVWMKADLVKYDADNQTYSIKSSTQVLVQPKKKEIAVVCPQNKYAAITEKNAAGYRRAYFHLTTEPEFTWYVNKQTALAAKSKEGAIYFKLAFAFDISFDESANQIQLQIKATKISLMDQNENFTYWSEDIR